MTPTTQPPLPVEPGGELLTVEELRTELATPRGELTAVDGVSFTLRAGETLGVVGESGSGKSVLGRTVIGLHTTGEGTRVTGRVRFEGVDVHAMSPAARRRMWGADVGTVFQDPLTALNPVRTVGAHLTETLRRHRGFGRRAARDRAEELLRLVGIPEPRRRLAQYPHELSGGMRQRVVLAVALANEPKLLLADEPTTALDVTVQRQILDLLDHLSAELHMAVLLISHNLGVVAGRADRVAVVYAGRIVELAPAAELFAHPRHPYTRALLASVPRLTHPPHTPLDAIGGAPPDMVAPPIGCRFAPRCPRADAACETAPSLVPVTAESANPPDGAGTSGISDVSADGTAHAVACHHPVEEALQGADEARAPAQVRDGEAGGAVDAVEAGPQQALDGPDVDAQNVNGRDMAETSDARRTTDHTTDQPTDEAGDQATAGGS